MMALGILSVGLKERSTTAPVITFLILVRTKAAPLPGLTCWKSTMVQTPPSHSTVMPFLKSPAVIMNQFLQLFRCLWVLYFQIRGTDSVKTHLPFSANGKVGSCACIAIFIVSQICADEKPFLRPKRKKCGFFHPPNRILLPIVLARAIQQEFPSSASNPFGNSATNRRGIFPHDALFDQQSLRQ